MTNHRGGTSLQSTEAVNVWSIAGVFLLSAYATVNSNQFQYQCDFCGCHRSSAFDMYIATSYTLVHTVLVTTSCCVFQMDIVIRGWIMATAALLYISQLPTTTWHQRYWKNYRQHVRYMEFLLVFVWIMEQRTMKLQIPCSRYTPRREVLSYRGKVCIISA